MGHIIACSMCRSLLCVLLLAVMAELSHTLTSEPPLTNTVGLAENVTSSVSEEAVNNADTPKNITGYYKGVWENLGIDARFKHVLFLDEPRGDVMMDLHIAEPSPSGFCKIQGDVLLKNGLRLTDDDIRFSVEGMYYVETEHLTAVLKPKRHIYLSVSETEIEQNSPHYREALRREAKRWIRHPAPLLRFGVPPEMQFQPKHDCEFLMDFRIAPTNDSATEDTELASSPIGMASDGFRMTGIVSSPNCNVTLSVNASSFHLEKYYTKAVHYTLVTAILTFVQILLLIKQIEGTSTPATSMRVSIICISEQTVMDAYLCLLHLTVGIVVEPLFNAFAMVSFFEFVLFAIFEMRYMLLIWRAQRGQSNDHWDTRRELSILYTRFYGVLLAGILAAFKLQPYMHALVFLMYSFWIPQVIHCIRADVRQPLKPVFIIGMSITRLLLPLYFYGCPSNILGVHPRPVLCLVLICYMALQGAVLMVQYYYGPHCFLPKRFLPHKHDYFRSLDPGEIEEVLRRNGDRESAEAGMTECVICMNSVEVGRPMARMVTPCNHFFHPQCLQRWMDVKMECPTCRQLLPPL